MSPFYVLWLIMCPVFGLSFIPEERWWVCTLWMLGRGSSVLEMYFRFRTIHFVSRNPFGFVFFLMRLPSYRTCEDALTSLATCAISVSRLIFLLGHRSYFSEFFWKLPDSVNFALTDAGFSCIFLVDLCSEMRWN